MAVTKAKTMLSGNFGLNLVFAQQLHNAWLIRLSPFHTYIIHLFMQEQCSQTPKNNA
jgi:hypothetical protein